MDENANNIQNLNELEKIVLDEIDNNHLRLNDNINIHKYFYEKKKEEPFKYRGLDFDNNGYNPVSDKLNYILFSLGLDGEIPFF